MLFAAFIPVGDPISDEEFSPEYPFETRVNVDSDQVYNPTKQGGYRSESNPLHQTTT